MCFHFHFLFTFHYSISLKCQSAFLSIMSRYECAFCSTTPATHLCTYTRQMATPAPSLVVFHAIFDVSTRLYQWFHQRSVPPVVIDLCSQCVKVFLHSAAANHLSTCGIGRSLLCCVRVLRTTEPRYILPQLLNISCLRGVM